jgi:hypothetical protein
LARKSLNILMMLRVKYSVEGEREKIAAVGAERWAAFTLKRLKPTTGKVK